MSDAAPPDEDWAQWSARLAVILKRTGAAAAFFGAVHLAASVLVPKILGRALVDRALAQQGNPAKRRANRRYLAEMVGSWPVPDHRQHNTFFICSKRQW